MTKSVILCKNIRVENTQKTHKNHAFLQCKSTRIDKNEVNYDKKRNG